MLYFGRDSAEDHENIQLRLYLEGITVIIFTEILSIIENYEKNMQLSLKGENVN